MIDVNLTRLCIGCIPIYAQEDFIYKNKNNNYNIYRLLGNFCVPALCKMLYMDCLI